MAEHHHPEVAIFNEALALRPGERAAFLDRACGGQAGLRHRVEVLLRAHQEAVGFMEPGGATQTLRVRTAEDLLPGLKVRYIGDYELLEKIGRGGMGIVFKARQISLNRDVAVKMILTGEYAGAEERRRFQREAEAAAQLRHPNIVAIHEVGDYEGRAYYSMDLIEGQTLAALLKEEGKLPPARAAELVRTLAEAVHFAHQRGTLHRDLKPGNVIIDKEACAHILDFGLARPVEKAGDLTRTGDVMGSPSYMPPEQAEGRVGEIGPPSDVYALGAILFEVLTGRPPFVGETAMEVLQQVLDKDPVPPRRINPGLPADLETICLKCLEKRPERRYHSARALAEELQRFLNFEPITAKPAGRLRRLWNWTQRNPWVFAAGFGLAALALLCVAFALWEQTHVLHWQLEAGKNATLPDTDLFFGLDAKEPHYWETPPARSESPALLFILFFPAVCLAIYFVQRDFHARHRRHAEGADNVPHWVFLRLAAAGAGAVAIGLSYLLWQIHSWMWESMSSFPLFELAGVGGALTLIWIGFRSLWLAVGAHETSRYQGLVKKIIEKQWAGEKQRRLGIRRTGVAWWACAVGLAVHLVLRASDPTRRARELAVTLGLLLLTTGVTALAVWAVARRRRLLTFVFMPAALLAGAVIFVVLTAEGRLGFILLLLAFISAFQTIVVFPLFLNHREGLRFRVSPWRDAALGVALALAMVVAFYQIENWRGRAALEKCQRALTARGAQLDWSHYVPPPIPDESNFFKAPKMAEWFVRSGHNGWEWLDAGFAPSPLQELMKPLTPQNTSYTIAQVTLASLAGIDPAVVASNADLVLVWKSSIFSVLAEKMGSVPRGNDEVESMVSFDNVPVKDALNALALQARMKIEFAPGLDLNQTYNTRWKDITARQALYALLDAYHLRLECVVPGSPAQQVFRVEAQSYGESADAKSAVRAVLERTLGRHVISSVDDMIAERPSDKTRPAQIIILGDTPPGTNEMAELFLNALKGDYWGYLNPTQPVQVYPAGAGNMSVTATFDGCASNYAAWSHQCEPLYDTIRQALQRPDARLDIDYSHPLNTLAQSWVIVRILSQTLQRQALADLLRGDTDSALHKAGLIHDMHRLCEGPRSGQPVPMVNAMINTAVTGLYASLISDCLEMQSWTDPQLAELQRQLKEVNLLRVVRRSVQFEQASTPRLIDITPRAQLFRMEDTAFLSGRPQKWNWRRVQLETFMRLCPRGWLDQNKAAFMEAYQPLVDLLDNGQPVKPQAMDDWQKREVDIDPEFAPYIWIKFVNMANFNRAFKTTSQNQTQINHALIACALARYRLAHHRYPTSLADLVPQYLEQIPPDVVGGQAPRYEATAPDAYNLSSRGWDKDERWTWPARY